MPILRFDDGVQFNTDGDYRIERWHDGLYVVGHGTLCPIDDYEEGRTMIRDFEQGRSSEGTKSDH